ncbi:MAG: DDE-type integrase/transposase/recombinase [Propionibacteriaceae bacterium]|nr:DDE-type integrase/transposase/recombinase [Propionibacteriaceae bacterium]
MAGKISRRERREQTALWRYQLIRDAIDEELTPKQRGQVVRQIAASSHAGLNGGTVKVSRGTIDRWVSAWRAGGFEALQPKQTACVSRTPVEVLELAASLKRERPERTCAQICRIIARMTGDSPSESTLLRHFRRLGLPMIHQEVHGRFEADFNNEIWVGDFLHGPVIGGRKTYLAAFLDDHSRYCVAARWALSEDVCRLSIALKPGLLAWGVPVNCYLDNGSAFRDDQLARACARLGVRLIHSAPYKPEGRGKIERFFNTVTSQFLVEIDPDGKTGIGTRVDSVDQLDRLFHAWVETVYHASINTTTGQTPLERWNAG